MARPEKITLPELLKALASAAPDSVKPSALAKALDVSRATVHRKLEDLLQEGLVVRTGDGPTAAYRTPTPQESLARADALRPDGLVRLVLDKRTAYAARESLELFTRLGIGQLEEVRQSVRMPDPGQPFPHDKLNRLDVLVAEFKRDATGMSQHASFGIYNPKVPDVVTQAWALMGAIRHRLAWDQTPEGSMGVWHDEPLFNEDSLQGLSVLSDTPGEDGKPSRYLVEMPREAVALLGRAAKVALRLSTCDFQVLMDLVEDGTIRHTEGKPATPELLARLAALVMAMVATMADGEDTSFNVALNAGEERLLRLVKACEAFSNSTAKVRDVSEAGGLIEISPLSESPIAFTVDDLPEGMLLNFKAGKYRVIAPRGTDELLSVIAESRSLQTVIQMAKNLARGSASRAVGF